MMWKLFGNLLKKSIMVILLACFGASLIILGLIAYSYNQIDAQFQDISSLNVELETLSFSSLLQLGLDVLSGNWLESAVALIARIDLGLIFELSNNGLLPVYIPTLTYDLTLNGNFVGNGSSTIDAMINPGETKEIQVTQNFEKHSFSTAIKSIIEKEGIIDVDIHGVAYFELLGLSIPIEFESTKQISIVEELQNQLNQQPLK